MKNSLTHIGEFNIKMTHITNHLLLACDKTLNLVYSVCSPKTDVKTNLGYLVVLKYIYIGNL